MLKAELKCIKQHMCNICVRMRQGCMECYGDCIFCRSVLPVGKVVVVQIRGDAVLDVFQDESLKTFHDDKGQCDCAVITEASGS